MNAAIHLPMWSIGNIVTVKVGLLNNTYICVILYQSERSLCNKDVVIYKLWCYFLFHQQKVISTQFLATVLTS